MSRTCLNPNVPNMPCFCPVCEEDKHSATAFVNNYLYNNKYSKLAAWIAAADWTKIPRADFNTRGSVHRGNVTTESHVISGEISC